MRKLALITMMLVLALAMTGCLTSITAETKKQAPDGSVTTSRVSVFGTGDKVASAAAEGLFADGTDADLGAGVKKASAKQESTGIAETFAGVGTMMAGMAQFFAATQGVKTDGLIASTPPKVIPTDPEVADGDSDTTLTLPTETATANSGVMKAKIAEAKATGKPLVILAGNTGCSYCERMDAALRASPGFANRTDIIFYHETSPWSKNQAAKWTGGGQLPALRVTQWAIDGSIVCDKKVNRPQTIEDLETTLGTCELPGK